MREIYNSSNMIVVIVLVVAAVVVAVLLLLLLLLLPFEPMLKIRGNYLLLFLFEIMPLRDRA